jgi:hypothetical protein
MHIWYSQSPKKHHNPQNKKNDFIPPEKFKIHIKILPKNSFKTKANLVSLKLAFIYQLCYDPHQKIKKGRQIKMIHFLVMFFKIIFWWTPKKFATNYEISALDAITAVPFGTNKVGEKLNPPNRALAEALRINKLRFPKLAILVQWEFADVLAGKFKLPAFGQVGSPRISTKEFFELIKKTHPDCKKLGIVAHPWHAFRSKWIGEKEGFEIKILNPNFIPWSPNDAHKQVRSNVYIFWEFLSRIHHLLNRWI